MFQSPTKTTSHSSKEFNNAPKKETIKQEFQGTPRRLNFDENETNSFSNNPVIIPNTPIQPFEQIEWVYPNDGESEFYTYEQMMNDWVDSDPEEYSSDEEDDYTTDQYYERDEWSTY